MTTLRSRHPHWLWQAAAFLLMLAGNGHAQWTDPTRPPQALPHSSSGSPAASSTKAGPAATPGLTLLLIGRPQPVAVIDGHTLSGTEADIDGVRYRITPTGAEREQDGDVQTLTPHPQVHKIRRAPGATLPSALPHSPSTP